MAVGSSPSCARRSSSDSAAAKSHVMVWPRKLQVIPTMRTRAHTGNFQIVIGQCCSPNDRASRRPWPRAFHGDQLEPQPLCLLLTDEPVLDEDAALRSDFDAIELAAVAMEVRVANRLVD